MTTTGRGVAIMLGERGVPEGVGATGPPTGIVCQSHCGSLSPGIGASRAAAGAVRPSVVDNAAGA